ncbi:exostosin-2 isoform X2 [Harpegnathos saltator]|uniref:exostosin-2 isoform X2 n=1 Tax=Harpegnathos saltator TaxID=610380 RepID=UPI00059169AF|nr:exostosin-2 isoform X2 [Harpegnathos saltator]XP_011135769.1 exostosin-2 isoform X2 [Harpegnathos saltator]
MVQVISCDDDLRNLWCIRECAQFVQHDTYRAVDHLKSGRWCTPCQRVYCIKTAGCLTIIGISQSYVYYRLQSEATNSSCTYFGCFNVYRCGSQGNKLLVYVYPLKIYLDSMGRPITSQMTKEFYQILNTIINSKFYTPNPYEACIFVPSIDTLNQNRLRLQEVSQALGSLPFWNKGENHVIFNMVPGSVPDYNTVIDVPIGRSIIAGAGMSSLTHRPGFDISLPVYSPLVNNIKTNLSNTRTWLVISSQININTAFEQDLLEVKTTYPKDILVLGPCLQYNPMNNTIRCIGEDLYKYPDILHSATFCLIIRGARLAQSVLLDAMAAGCIPVIIADSLIMPFHDVIDWTKAAILVREVDILLIIQLLKKISHQRIVEMQEQNAWLYDRYFSSMEKITETTLEILADRVFPHLTRDYTHWNIPSYKGKTSPLFLPVTAPKTRGFTAVILTYDRLELLFLLINKLVKVPSLSKVLVIWNNQQKDPPHSSRWPKVNKPLKVIQTKENKLSNRFYPYDEIETEAVLSIDDDIIMLTADEVEFAYEVWREFPDRIVGFPSRIHMWDNGTNCWKYESEWTNSISMVLTGAAFHHKYWNYMYTTAMPGDIKEWVDEHMNCEDIAMNFLVANITGKAPIKVTPKKKFRCPECTNTEMLSADLTHMVERTQCINKFSSIYGTMPLKSVEFRADPVLFKDVFPEKLKRFNDIGSL